MPRLRRVRCVVPGVLAPSAFVAPCRALGVLCPRCRLCVRARVFAVLWVCLAFCAQVEVLLEGAILLTTVAEWE